MNSMLIYMTLDKRQHMRPASPYSSKTLLFCISLCYMIPFMSFSAQAKDPESVQGNHIHFSVSASDYIANDEIHVQLSTIQQAESAFQVSEKINRAMQQALKELKKYPAIHSQTSHYHVQPQLNKKREITHWTGQQRLHLRFAHQPELLKVLTPLQQTLHFHSLQFSLSKQRQQKVQQQLTEKALTQFQAQAKTIAQQFNRTDFQIIETRIHSNAAPFPHIEHRQSGVMMEASVASAPAISGGESLQTVTVSGKMVLPY